MTDVAPPGIDTTTLTAPRPPAPPEPPDDHDWQPAQHLDATPRDRAAEELVIGAALHDPAVVDRCASIITAGDFFWPHHMTLWRAITALHAADAPTDPVAVLNHLRDAGQLRQLGDPTILTRLYTDAPAEPLHALYHAEKIDALSRRRQAIERVQHSLQRLRTPGPDTDVDAILHTVAAELTEARDDLTNPPASTSWAAVDLEPVFAGEYLDPPPQHLRRSDGIPLLYAGAVHSISGESESGKTWLALLAVTQELANPDGGRTVFLDFEDRADRVIGRLLALGATIDQLRARFTYIRPDRPLDDDGRAQLAPHLHGATIAIVDGVTEAMTMHGYDLNSNADSATFQAQIPRWIADHGPATVLIDHVVKDKEKQGRFALGAQHKLAGLDGVAYLVTMVQPFARGKRGLARVDIGKDRPGHVREHAYGKTIAEFSLDATGSETILTATLTPAGQQTADASPWEPTHIMERISRTVQLTPGLSKKALEDTLNGKTAHKRLALELLVTRGYVETRTAKYGRIEHHHLRPYYANADDADAPTDDPWETPQTTTGDPQ